MHAPPVVAVALPLLLSTLGADGPTRPVRLTPSEATAVTAAIEKDRTDTEQWLRADPTSYLATVDRRDFLSKATLTVGRAADNDVRIEDGALEPHHLRVTIDGDRFRVEAIDAPARFTASIGGKDEVTRTATLEPSSIRIGRFFIRLSHQRFPALIVFDPASPRLKEYKGLKYFPIGLAFRYELPLTPNSKRDIVMVLSTRGNQRRAERVGWFDFMVGDTPCRLEALRLLEPGVGETEFGIFFKDVTSGRETYGLGRYVDVQRLPNGRYLLDFNMAYNPACAFSDHYNCPIPPRANVLSVAIRAGEMDSRYH